MTTPRYREDIYKRFASAPRWMVDFAIDYADEHRNDDYIVLLMDYGVALLERQQQLVKEHVDNYGNH